MLNAYEDHELVKLVENKDEDRLKDLKYLLFLRKLCNRNKETFAYLKASRLTKHLVDIEYLVFTDEDERKLYPTKFFPGYKQKLDDNGDVVKDSMGKVIEIEDLSKRNRYKGDLSITNHKHVFATRLDIFENFEKDLVNRFNKFFQNLEMPGVAKNFYQVS